MDLLVFDFNRPIHGTIGRATKANANGSANKRQQVEEEEEEPEATEYKRLLLPRNGELDAHGFPVGPAAQSMSEGALPELPAEREGLRSLYPSVAPTGTTAPFSRCVCCSTPRIEFHDLVDEWREKKEPWREILLSTEMIDPRYEFDDVFCSSFRAHIGVFRASLPRTALFAFVQEGKKGKDAMSSDFEGEPMPPLAPEVAAIIAAGGARNNLQVYHRPLPPTLSQALASLLVVMPFSLLFRHALDDTPLSRCSFTHHRSVLGKFISFFQLLEAVVYMRLQAEWDLPHVSAPISAPLVRALLALHPLSTEEGVGGGSVSRAARGEALVVAVARAFYRQGNWDAMGTNVWRGWCCPCLGPREKDVVVRAQFNALLNAASSPDQRARIQAAMEDNIVPGNGWDMDEGAWSLVQQVHMPACRRFSWDFLSRTRQRDQARLQNRQWAAAAQRAQQWMREEQQPVSAQNAAAAAADVTHGKRLAAFVFARLFGQNKNDDDDAASSSPAVAPPVQSFVTLPSPQSIDSFASEHNKPAQLPPSRLAIQQQHAAFVLPVN
jgi:hypothetical protein